MREGVGRRRRSKFSSPCLHEVRCSKSILCLKYRNGIDEPNGSDELGMCRNNDERPCTAFEHEEIIDVETVEEVDSELREVVQSFYRSCRRERV